MLPEHITQLLTAYVDGELSARERKSVTRLLRKSAEARRMLEMMKQDSMILRHLPRKKTQLDLSGSVMGTISLRGIKLPKIEPDPKLPPLPSDRPAWYRRIPGWVTGLVAALLLVAIGYGSYRFFSATLDPDMAKDHPKLTPDKPRSVGPQPEDPDEPPQVISVVHEVDPLQIGGSDAPKTAPPSHEKAPAGMRTSVKLPTFVTARPRLMSILNMKDLEQLPTAAQLTQELRNDSAARIDLFCAGDTTRAIDRLKAALQGQGITLRFDSVAQTRYSQKLKTNYAIYSEDLSADELVKALQQIAVEDKKSGTPTFDKLTINLLNATEMSRTLGGDVANYEQPPYKGPLGVDIRQDVSDKTGQQIVQAMSRESTARADGQPPTKPTRQAVLVTYNLPMAGYSGEIKKLVENRKEWRPGAVQALLVLWNN